MCGKLALMAVGLRSLIAGGDNIALASLLNDESKTDQGIRVL